MSADVASGCAINPSVFWCALSRDVEVVGFSSDEINLMELSHEKTCRADFLYSMDE